MAMANLEDVLECGICLDRMKQPKMLRCQHTFCKACLEKMDGHDSITCPECRGIHFLDNEGVNGLPNNLTITKLLGVATEKTAKKSTAKLSCQDCKKNNIYAECRHCDKIVCRDCLIKHTRAVNDEFQRAVREVEKLLPAVSAAIPNSKKDHETVKKNVAAVRTEIEAWKRRCLTNLASTAEDMLEDVDEFEEAEIRPYEELKEYQASIQSISEIAKKKSQEVATMRGTEIPIQVLQSEMMDMIKKCNECATSDIVGVVKRKTVTTLRYRSGISDCIAGLVSNFKEIGLSPPQRSAPTSMFGFRGKSPRSRNIKEFVEHVKTLKEITEEVCPGEIKEEEDHYRRNRERQIEEEEDHYPGQQVVGIPRPVPVKELRGEWLRSIFSVHGESLT